MLSALTRGRAIFGVATLTGVLAPPVLAASKRDERMATAKAGADTAKANAEAARAAADATRATAEADKIKAETALKAQEAANSEAARKRADDSAAEARRSAEKTASDAARRADEGNKFWLSLGTTVAGVAIGAVLGKMMGKAGAAAIANRGNAITGGLGELGASAAKLLKSAPKGKLAGTTAGDAAKGIVMQAGKLEKGLGTAGHVSKLDAALPALTFASGVAESAYSFVAPNEGVAMASRAAGAASIVASIAASKSLLTANRLIVRPGASQMAALNGLKVRLARETPKVKASASSSGASAARSAPDHPRATSSGSKTVTRTYTTGPKAGITETFTTRGR